MALDIRQALAAKERAVDGLMARPGVVGVGVTEKDGRPAIRILVRELTPELQAQLPDEIEGHPVIVDEVGEIRPA